MADPTKYLIAIVRIDGYLELGPADHEEPQDISASAGDEVRFSGLPI